MVQLVGGGIYGGCGMDGVFLVGAWICVVGCGGLSLGGGGKWLFLLLPRIERDGNDQKEGKEERKRKR